MKKNLKSYRTQEELDENPYPNNVMTICHYFLEDDEEYEEDSSYEYDPESWISGTYCIVHQVLLFTYVVLSGSSLLMHWSHQHTTFNYFSDGSEMSASANASIVDAQFWPCNVLSRETDADGNDVYEVQIIQTEAPEAPITVWHTQEIPRILTNYSKEGILFMASPYSSDQHLPGVFRSYLRIPDDMFPEQWKDSIDEE